MLRVLILIAAMIFPACCWAAGATISLSIESMTCGPDPHSIRAALEAVPGVSAVTIGLETRTATVTFDDEKLSVNQLLAAVGGAGHAALAMSAKPLASPTP